MNGKDFISILEYVKTFDKPQKAKRWGKKDKEPKMDLVGLLRQKKEEAELLEKFLKEQEKLSKKEEDKKKEEKSMRALTFAEGVVLAYVAQFLLGPLYNHYITLLQVH